MYKICYLSVTRILVYLYVIFYMYTWNFNFQKFFLINFTHITVLQNLTQRISYFFNSNLKFSPTHDFTHKSFVILKKLIYTILLKTAKRNKYYNLLRFAVTSPVNFFVFKWIINFGCFWLYCSKYYTIRKVFFLKPF